MALPHSRQSHVWQALVSEQLPPPHHPQHLQHRPVLSSLLHLTPVLFQRDRTSSTHCLHLTLSFHSSAHFLPAAALSLLAHPALPLLPVPAIPLPHSVCFTLPLHSSFPPSDLVCPALVAVAFAAPIAAAPAAGPTPAAASTATATIALTTATTLALTSTAAATATGAAAAAACVHTVVASPLLLPLCTKCTNHPLLFTPPCSLLSSPSPLPPSPLSLFSPSLASSQISTLPLTPQFPLNFATITD
ncbi:unnamed protein product [Closterium sp. NIES-54]